jgi:hypothetical protein
VIYAMLIRFIYSSACILPIMLAAVGLLPATAAETELELILRPDPTGLCDLPEIGGLWVNDLDGRLVRLEDLCRRLQPERFAAERLTIVLEESEVEFWQSFLEVASPSAIEFANQMDRKDVVEYGKSVCISLNQGDNMETVRAVQIEGGLPSAFDAAVNVAAINTYCPVYRYQIGR